MLLLCTIKCHSDCVTLARVVMSVLRRGAGHAMIFCLEHFLGVHRCHLHIPPPPSALLPPCEYLIYLAPLVTNEQDKRTKMMRHRWRNRNSNKSTNKCQLQFAGLANLEVFDSQFELMAIHFTETILFSRDRTNATAKGHNVSIALSNHLYTLFLIKCCSFCIWRTISFTFVPIFIKCCCCCWRCRCFVCYAIKFVKL